ncbi:LexA family protein [Pseudochrobactrum saccharolyticum]|uniref:LexA family protein n=1 Tax=Pseudochrobactrum saccharolyticum TaxID=354352 RepID=UPI002770149B|nr:S24 family peptidase [Pseudochrobactrum saccharolyticum]MDP8249598.1 helix-turn-helix domain-containing protein [Pseudochrobactrum saccharolyticum]
MTENLKKEIVERVQQRMEEVNLSMRAVGLASGHGPDLIRDWLRAKGLPRLDSLIKVASVLNTSPEWLAFGIEDKDAVSVPIISMISAGIFRDTETIETLDNHPTMRITDLPRGEWVALKVTGDSMDRISPPESIILVNRRDKTLVPGSCYVVFDDDGRATYKRYRSNPDRFEPVSTNPNHEPIFPREGNTPQIFGKVKRTILNI